jgi:Elongation factor Tu GTP binding domain
VPTLNLGILAHVDAGKTSLTERLLFAAGVIDEIGRVDDGSTQTDTMALERQRGITIKAAVATLLGLRTVNDRCQITALCANRFARVSRDYVGTIAQDALIAVDLTAGTFDGIIQATRTATLAAYYYSRYDAESLWQMISRVNEDRGTEFHRDCVLNDLNGAAVQVQTGSAGSMPEQGDAENAMRDTRLVRAEADPRPLLFYFEVFGLTRHDVSLSVWADQSRFPAAEVEDFLFAVEHRCRPGLLRS